MSDFADSGRNDYLNQTRCNGLVLHSTTLSISLLVPMFTSPFCLVAFAH